MKLLFLIPARGGSKGFPGKNLARLAGVPLVGRAAVTARHAAMSFPQSRIICTTDDPAIAVLARAWGAEVPFVRPAALASDTATSLDVVRHALDTLDEPFDAVVLLQPTSPLTEAEDVRRVIETFASTGDPSVSMCSDEHPVEWHHRLDSAGRLTPVVPASIGDQRQASERSYRPNGAVYVASPEQIRGAGFWTPATRGVVMPLERSIDIDTPLDFAIARAFVAERPAPAVRIGGYSVGAGSACFVIAEAGVNHNGDLALAMKLVDAASSAGADAVKFQTFQAAKLTTRLAPKAEYQKARTDAGESQFDMLKRLELGPADHRAIIARCAAKGIMFLSSPFDEESADLLDELGVPAFKISSGELTNIPLLRHVAAKGKPVIVSTGMATLEEVQSAVTAVKSAGGRDLVLLHCVSNYPADPADTNLRAMATMRDAFDAPVGYSDHTIGPDVPLAAVALGACLVEKHFTLDRTLPGPDHQASAEPAEFAALVSSIRRIEAAFGDGEKRPAESERDTARVARRSLVAAVTIPPGRPLTAEMVTARRPGTGLSPDRVGELLGRRAIREIADGTSLALDMFE